MPYKKITSLDALTAITDDDLLVAVNSPASGPGTRKITWAQILAYFATGANTLTLSNAGLHLLGTGGSYDVIIAPIETGGALAADRTLSLDLYGQNRTLGLQSSLYVTGGTTPGRTLTFATGDANRTVTIGNDNMPLHAANVRYYGAVGDGATDDTAAFTAALAANDWVYVPNGTYSVSQITLGSGKWLVGESREKTIISDNGGSGTTYDGSRCLLYVVDTTASGISNLKLLGRGEGSYDDIAIVAHACQYFKAHNVWVDYFQGRGIFIAHDVSRYQEWQNIWISRIYDTDAGNYGIGLWLYGGGGYGGPRNNVFYGVHTELTDDAAVAIDAGTTTGVGDSPNDNLFVGLSVLNPCRVRGSAIGLSGAKNTLIDGFTIDYLTTTDTVGITLSIDQTGETCLYNRIVNGVLRYCGGQPILFTSASYNTLENIVIEEVGLSGNRPLILLQDTTINGGGSGGGCTGNIVRGIRVRQSASSNYTYGVEFDATNEDMLSNRFQMIDWGTYASGLYHVTGLNSVPFTGANANTFLYDSAGIDQDVSTGASPTFAGITLSGATASRLLATDGSKAAASVADLTAWVAGTANRVTVANDGDGSITLSAPQDIHTAATPQFAAMGLGTAASASSILAASKTYTAASGAAFAVHLVPTLSPSGDGTAAVYAIGCYPTVGGVTTDMTLLAGFYIEPNLNHGAGSSLATVYGIVLSGYLGSTSAGYVNEWHQIRIGDISKHASSTETISCQYGLFIDAQTRGNTNYSIYVAGGTSYFGGNVLLGGAAAPGSAAKCLTIYNGTAPDALADTSTLYTSGGEGYWADAAGNDTLQTPHAKDAPPDMYVGHDNEAMDYTYNRYTGVIRWHNPETGVIRYETAAEYNARLGLRAGDARYKVAKGQAGWEADHQASAAQRAREQAAWDSMPESQRSGPRPEKYVIPPYPFAKAIPSPSQAQRRNAAKKLLTEGSPLLIALRAMSRVIQAEMQGLKAAQRANGQPPADKTFEELLAAVAAKIDAGEGD